MLVQEVANFTWQLSGRTLTDASQAQMQNGWTVQNGFAELLYGGVPERTDSKEQAIGILLYFCIEVLNMGRTGALHVVNATTATNIQLQDGRLASHKVEDDVIHTTVTMLLLPTEVRGQGIQAPESIVIALCGDDRFAT